MAKKLEGSAGDRLLAAANELFYSEGIHTVGIDRVIERAGVAKASLYATYGSKEGLVAAYLADRARLRRERVTAKLAQHPGDPRAQILAVFDLVAELASDRQYRGCAFINATAEGPRDDDTAATRARYEMRAWLHDTFVSLARDVGAHSPTALAAQLVVLYDGAVVGSGVDHSPASAQIARTIAAAMIDAAVAPA